MRMATTGLLDGRYIMVVEDDYLIADHLVRALEAEGARVLGPVSSVASARAFASADRRIDGAVLDINLRGEMVFSVADLLSAMRVPFVFATGYEASMVPSAHAHVPRCEKPVQAQAIVRALARPAGADDRRSNLA